MVVPVAQSIPEFLESIDIDCTINLLAKQAADTACKVGMETARSRVHQISVDMLRASKLGTNQMAMNQPYGPGNQMQMQQQQQQQQQPTSSPASLQLLPLYSMSLQKSLALRGGNDVRVDERSFYLQLLGTMNIDESRIFIYPRMFSIHDMTADVGIPSDSCIKKKKHLKNFNHSI